MVFQKSKGPASVRKASRKLVVRVLAEILEMEAPDRVLLLKHMRSLYCVGCGEGRLSGTCACDEEDTQHAGTSIDQNAFGAYT